MRTGSTPLASPNPKGLRFAPFIRSWVYVRVPTVWLRELPFSVLRGLMPCLRRTFRVSPGVGSLSEVLHLP